MDAERYEQVRRVFMTVCELPREAQAQLLDERCADDAELRDAVMQLLEKDDVVGQDLRIVAAHDDLTDDAIGRVADTLSGKPPETIGRYRIVRTIAEGGMAPCTRRFRNLRIEPWR